MRFFLSLKAYSIVYLGTCSMYIDRTTYVLVGGMCTPCGVCLCGINVSSNIGNRKSVFPGHYVRENY